MRDSRQGNYSIEQIFDGIRSELKEQVEFELFYPNKPLDWKAVLNVGRYSGDVNHITGDSNYLIYGIPSKRTLLTVHDIGHFERSLKGVRKAIYGLVWFRLPLRKAHRITAVSDFTANKLMIQFGVQASKIDIIYDPILPVFTPSQRDLNLEFPTILQIGSGGHKNLDRLIDAIRGLSCKLLLIRRPDDHIRRKMELHNIIYTWRSNISMQEILAAYNEADILFFGSTYEGFGMPIIESQAIGRPVITSSIRPMIETSGQNGAVLVDPYSVDEIRKAIIKLMNSKYLCDQLIGNGFENVKKYSIKKIANQYLNLYELMAH